MTRFVLSVLKIAAYYLLLFAACRLVFLLYFVDEVTKSGSDIFFKSLWHALPLDISAASYLLFIPLILLLLSTFDKSEWLYKTVKAYLAMTTIAIAFLSMSEIAVYRELNVKLYFNLLLHLLHPSELFHTVSYGLIFSTLFFSILIAGVSIWSLKFFVDNTFAPTKNIKLTAGRTLVFIAGAGTFALGARGGWQPIPINEGEVYFSDNQCVNDATVNPVWNLVHSYIENKLVLSGDAYKVMPNEEAQKIVTGLFHTESDTSVSIFKTKRPNICFLILESWSADVVASLGGFEGLTPMFDSLVNDGYLFANIRPAGHLSDQGIPAILSGYPALPIGSAINQPERQVHLPCINNELHAAGYTSSFYFGGQLIYGNIKSYIYRNGFSQVLEQQTLPSSLPSGRLGINDSVMMELWRDSITKMKQPFFSCLFTLSSHMPYDIPARHTIEWGDYHSPYLNSIHYCDQQIGLFFEKARKEPWYQNTIFIIVADHSHSTPKNYDSSSPEFYHIPLLIAGGALKDEYRDKKFQELGSQTDIAATLFAQLGLSSKNYRWSKNLLNPSVKKFAFYTFNEGFGYLENSQAVVWNKKFPATNRNIPAQNPLSDSLYRKGSAMLQMLMSDFLSETN